MQGQNPRSTSKACFWCSPVSDLTSANVQDPGVLFQQDADDVPRQLTGLGGSSVASPGGSRDLDAPMSEGDPSYPCGHGVTPVNGSWTGVV